MKKILCILFAVLMVVSCCAITAGASSAFQTYVYDIYGYPLYSPDAYTATIAVDSKAMGLDL